MKKIGVVIVAGGLGTRLGKHLPKGIIKIGEKSMFTYSLMAFQSLAQTSESIVLVTPAGWGENFRREIEKENLHEPYAIVDGGARRQDSVRMGLLALPDKIEYVLIHDAARPFITPNQIKRFIKMLDRNQAVTFASKVRDTLRVGQDEKGIVYLQKTLDRENLWALGTPQGFAFDVIMKVHLNAQKKGIEASDDTSLLPKSIKVAVYESDAINMKITYPSDIELADSLVLEWKKRFAQGQ